MTAHQMPKLIVVDVIVLQENPPIVTCAQALRLSIHTQTKGMLVEIKFKLQQLEAAHINYFICVLAS